MKKHYSSLNTFSGLLLVTAIFFQACVKDKIDLNKSGNSSISPQYAGALIYSSLTIKDILNNTNKNGQLTTDSTGFITLVYKGNLFSLKAADVVTIPAQTPVTANVSLSATEAAALNALPNGSSITVSDSSLVNFQTGGGAQVDILNCKTATLALNLNYTIKDNAVIKVTIPGATLGGVAFTQTIPVTYTGSPVNISNNYALDGYKIDMTNGNTTHDVIKIRYDVIITKSSPALSTVGDGASFTETFTNVAYNSIIGYLGQQFLSPSTDTIPITLFQNSLLNNGATFHILNPLIKVFLTNSYGLPIKASFNIFEGYSPGPPATNYPITGSGIPNPIPIPTATTIGQSAIDSFSLDKNNSNIFTLINQLPKNLIYNVNSQSNPLGPVYSNFITDSSQFKIDMELDLPLEGTASNFLFQDTVAYSFDMNTDQVKSITVRSYINNGFPVDVNMRLAFVDSAYNVIDELISPITPTYQLIIPSASIGANGMVAFPTASSHDFIIPSSVIPQLNKVKHILIGAIANTINGGTTNVKIYDFYHIDVKLGVNVELYLKF
ncbi:MAG TPA: hypothetical protein VN698_01225 [Bacteroidia bacterium]|nr:hypothetical protein [Bacteroidia bacterium]